MPEGDPILWRLLLIVFLLDRGVIKLIPVIVREVSLQALDKEPEMSKQASADR